MSLRIPCPNSKNFYRVSTVCLLIVLYTVLSDSPARICPSELWPAFPNSPSPAGKCPKTLWACPRGLTAKYPHCYLSFKLFNSAHTSKKSRECHNHKPQPFPDPRRKRYRQIQTSTNRTNVRKALRLALSSPSEVIVILKGLNNTRTK